MVSEQDIPQSLDGADAAVGQQLPKLDVCNVCISWDGQPVVEGVTFSVDAGECVCILGRSGIGKTTLLHALAGLIVPDSGRILLDGNDVTGHPGHIGYMLQKDLLLAHMDILDNVALPLFIKGTPKAQARSKAASLFPDFGLEGTELKYPYQLSGGMRQRAAFLRTCMCEDDVILMDEPFSALDAMTRADMQQWFLDMRRRMGLAAVLITHDKAEADILADRIYTLESVSEKSKLPSTLR